MGIYYIIFNVSGLTCAPISTWTFRSSLFKSPAPCFPGPTSHSNSRANGNRRPLMTITISLRIGSFDWSFVQ